MCTVERDRMGQCFSIVPRPSPALFLATYVTFEPPSDKRLADGGSKVTYVAKSGAGDGLGTRLSVFSVRFKVEPKLPELVHLHSGVFMQASTLDGVLELKNEHFWTIAFGSYVSSCMEPALYTGCMCFTSGYYSAGRVTARESEERCR